MTGNDIVDMATAAIESNWKRKGFLEKQFTPREQRCIQAAAFPEKMVWKLWSMKESAYKIYTRQFGGRFFAPLKCSCSISGETNDSVIISNIIYQTRTIFTANYIYTIAKPVTTGDTFIANHCLHIPDPEHIDVQKFIYQEMINCYSGLTSAEKSSIAIIKNEFGIPFLFCEEDRSMIPVSITHHGNYAAFTIN